MAAAAPGAEFPMDVNLASSEIYQLVTNSSLSELTSLKVRQHLKDTFGIDFDPYKEKIKNLTRSAIEKMQKEKQKSSKEDSDSDSDSDDDDIKPPKQDDEEDNEPAKRDDSSDSDSDHGLASTQRAPVKKRKGRDSEVFEDIASNIKSTRRAAASKALKEFKKGGVRMDSKSKKPKDPNEDNSGKFGRMTKLCYISPELQSIVGERYMKRCDVVKKLWEYVKSNELLDPKNKQFVICDDKLQAVVKRKRFKGFGMMQYFKNHVVDPQHCDPETEAEINQEMKRLRAEWLERKAKRESEMNDDEPDTKKLKKEDEIVKKEESEETEDSGTVSDAVKQENNELDMNGKNEDEKDSPDESNDGNESDSSTSS